MAHIPPSAAIFSPSVARLASSTAKDWNYVDSWLASKFPGRSPPPFERNPETLKVLVALAAANESADEDRELVASLEAHALRTLTSEAASEAASKDSQPDASPEAVVQGVLAAIEDGLSREGRSALDSLAAVAVELDVAFPEPAALGRKMAELQTRAFQLEQARARMDVLQAYVDEQTAAAQSLLRELGSDEYRPAPTLAKLNLELQRKVKAGASRLQDTRERPDGPDTLPGPTVQEICAEEDAYRERLAYKNALDQQIRSFQGLPPDRDLARQQLEALRSDLQAATLQRDRVFEGLVEKATPKKAR